MKFDSLRSARCLLLIDATTCGVMGAVLTLGADALGSLARMPPALLFYAGLGLFPIAAFMAVVATRPVIQPAAMWLVVAGNGLWVVASLMLVLAGWIAPNPLGTALIVAQALVVAVLAKLEHDALRGALLQPRTS
jgi:hypothetical protein